MKKKIIAMLLSVVMAVSLTACGSGSGAGKEKDTNISSELTYDHSMESVSYTHLSLINMVLTLCA